MAKKKKKIPHVTSMYYTKKDGERIKLGYIEWKMVLPDEKKHGNFIKTLMVKQVSQVQEQLVEELLEFEHEEIK